MNGSRSSDAHQREHPEMGWPIHHCETVAMIHTEWRVDCARELQQTKLQSWMRARHGNRSVEQLTLQPTVFVRSRGSELYEVSDAARSTPDAARQMQ